MRTTLNLADDVVKAARALARAQRRSLGNVISDLARETLGLDRGITFRNGFPTFAVGIGASALTSETVRRAQEEE